jgi:hypothetical protein
MIRLLKLPSPPLYDPVLFLRRTRKSFFLLSKHCQSSYKMLTLLLVLLFLGRRAAFAAPFQNLTDTQLTSNWESGPSGRGTTNILYNSACTLALCVWNSVHLNISAVRENKWVTYRRKIKWVFIALLAPELLVFTAFQQWLAARKFLRELKCVQDERAPEVGTQVIASIDTNYFHRAPGTSHESRSLI